MGNTAQQEVWTEWNGTSKYMDVQQAVNLEMMRAFAREGIVFAYPSRTLFIEGPVQVALPSREEGSEDGDAVREPEGSGKGVRRA